MIKQTTSKIKIIGIITGIMAIILLITIALLRFFFGGKQNYIDMKIERKKREQMNVFKEEKCESQKNMTEKRRALKERVINHSDMKLTSGAWYFSYENYIIQNKVNNCIYEFILEGVGNNNKRNVIYNSDTDAFLIHCEYNDINTYDFCFEERKKILGELDASYYEFYTTIFNKI